MTKPKGIAQGITKHFGETIHISESACMLSGEPVCEITFSTIESPSPGKYEPTQTKA
jgi:hypothetical protein